MPDGRTPSRLDALGAIAERDIGPGGAAGTDEQAANLVMQAAQLLMQAAALQPALEPAVRQALTDIQTGVSALAGGPPVSPGRAPRVGYSVSVTKAGGRGRGRGATPPPEEPLY